MSKLTDAVKRTRDEWTLDMKGLGRAGDSQIPDHMVEPIEAYVQYGRPVGGFLTALLSNDLTGSVARADDTNRQALPAYAMLMHCRLPSQCHGSREKVDAWLQAHRELRAAEPCDHRNSEPYSATHQLCPDCAETVPLEQEDR